MRKGKDDKNNIDAKSDWIDIETQGLPDFREYGFHTGKLVDVRRHDGTEETILYQGYGLFGNGVSMFKAATHWRHNVKLRG